MTAQPDSGPLLEAGPHRWVPGFVLCRRQPSMVVAMRWRGPAGTDWEGVHRPLQQAVEALWPAAFQAALPMRGQPEQVTDWRGWVQSMGAWTVALMEAGGAVTVDEPMVLELPGPTAGTEAWTTLLLPVLPGAPAATLEAWQVVLKVADRVLRGDGVSVVQDVLVQGREAVVQRLPRDSNTLRFLRAAAERQIPVLPVGSNLYQYGYGRQALWLNSSFTSHTPNVSARLARDKLSGAGRLRQAGIPVPDHQLVADEDDAVRAASRLGFPVVVKPVDQDGGRGVAAGLGTEAEVREAFAHALTFSQRVLVEKHVQGRDYRLTVLDGQLLWAVERVPAGVTGDGRQSVAQLVAQENARSERGTTPQAALQPLVLDAEAKALLDQQGLSETAVPADGLQVRLRRIANVAAGGRPVAVTDHVHPDNARLAVRAAAALRLDLAGVDLLIPDIARSWLDTGAAVCEVNAQPQLGALTGGHLYGAILDHRLRGTGRVPVLVLVEPPTAPSQIGLLVGALRAQGYCVGWAGRDGVGVDDECLARSAADLLAAGTQLITDARIDAVVLSCTDDRLAQTGLPVDRLDWVVLAGPANGGQARALAVTLPVAARRFLLADGALAGQPAQTATHLGFRLEVVGADGLYAAARAAFGGVRAPARAGV